MFGRMPIRISTILSGQETRRQKRTRSKKKHEKNAKKCSRMYPLSKQSTCYAMIHETGPLQEQSNVHDQLGCFSQYHVCFWLTHRGFSRKAYTIAALHRDEPRFKFFSHNLLSRRGRIMVFCRYDFASMTQYDSTNLYL